MKKYLYSLLLLPCLLLAAPNDVRITKTNTAGTANEVVVLADPGANRLIQFNNTSNTLEYVAAGAGSVTDVSVVTANGVSGSVATSTTTPAITLTLGAITPSSVAIGSDPADAGVIRLENAAVIGWEAAPASTDITLTVNSAEQFVFSNALLSPTLVTPALGTPSALVLTNATGLPVAGGGTGRATGTTAYSLVATGTTATGAQQTLASAATTEILVGGGASALPVWTTATGTGAPVRAGTPTLTTPVIGAATGTSLVLTGGVTTGSGGGVTGVQTFTGSTSGSLIITGVNAMAQNVTLSLAAQTSGPATLSIPDQAGVNRNITTDTGTQTLTNKRITARITTVTSNATPTCNTDNTDILTITAQAAAITSMTSNLTGTPSNGDQLEVRIKDDGTPRAITWGASFVAGPVALPTTTVTSKALRNYFEYDTVAVAWVLLYTGSDL